MLILTRRKGTSFFINDQEKDVQQDEEKITITVLGVKGNQVRIGIDAPEHMNIVREELVTRGQKKK